MKTDHDKTLAVKLFNGFLAAVVGAALPVGGALILHYGRFVRLETKMEAVETRVDEIADDVDDIRTQIHRISPPYQVTLKPENKP